MRNLIVLLLLVGSVLPVSAQLVPAEIDGYITMKVPAGLKARNPTMQRTTAPSLAMFMSDDFRVELMVTRASLQWGAEDVQLLSQFYKANILNLYDKVDMIKEVLDEVQGKPSITFEFVGQILEEPNAFKEAKKQSDYVYIRYIIVDDGVLVFRFTSPAMTKNKWQDMANESMTSIVFKGKKKR